MLDALVSFDDFFEFGVDGDSFDGLSALAVLTGNFGNFFLGFDVEPSSLDFAFDFCNHGVAVDTEIADLVTVAHLERVDLDLECSELGFDKGLVGIDVLESIANLDALLFRVLPSGFDSIAGGLDALVNDIFNLGFIELVGGDERFVGALTGGGLFVEFLELGLEFLGVDQHIFGRLDILSGVLVILITNFFNLVLGRDKACETALCLVSED